MRCFFEYETPLGKVNISELDGRIDGLNFGEYNNSTHAKREETSILKKASDELFEYFQGKRKSFDLPLYPQGTDFQRSVWNALTEIPYGETRSYKDIATTVGVPKGFRAVGLANNKNPISIFVPCHRVIGSSGSLVGYGGGLNIKEYLLELEKSVCDNKN